MDEKKSILIVDDDQDIRDLLAKYLNQQQFKTLMAKNAVEADKILAEEQVDLIVLDVMMPGEDGLSLCRRTRHSLNIPIIILSAIDAEVDQIVGLELGADDYLTKPFNPRMLLAKIRTVLRRYETAQNASETSDGAVIYQFANWKANISARTLFAPDGTEVILSSAEYELLLVFLEHPQRVLTRDMLLDFTRNREAGPFDRSIDILVSRLRAKLEEDTKKPKLLKTIRNQGYMLTEKVIRQ